MIGITGITLAGCATPTRPVATDVQTLDKPVAALCRIAWPKKPAPYVATVQLTGNDAVDALLVGRAAEAELEELRAYRKQLEAAAAKCVEPR